MKYVINGLAILGTVVLAIFLYDNFRASGGYFRSPVAFEGSTCDPCGTGNGAPSASDYDEVRRNYGTIGQ